MQKADNKAVMKNQCYSDQSHGGSRENDFTQFMAGRYLP